MNVAGLFTPGRRFLSRFTYGTWPSLPKPHAANLRGTRPWTTPSRKGREINVTIRELCPGWRRYSMRFITKGLRQLEDLGFIRRDKCMALQDQNNHVPRIRFTERVKKNEDRALENGRTEGPADRLGGGPSRPERERGATTPGARRGYREFAAGMNRTWVAAGTEPGLGGMVWKKIEGAVNVEPNEHCRADSGPTTTTYARS